MASRAPVPSQTSDHKCLVCNKSEGILFFDAETPAQALA